MVRKIIQISESVVPETQFHQLVWSLTALCDDGTYHKTKHPKPLTNSGFFITSKSINNPKQEKTKWLKQMFMNS